MGPGQNFFTQVGSGQFFVARIGLGWVRHSWYGFEFWKFPLKMSNFSIFFPSGQRKLLRVRSESTRVKARLASYLMRVKSKLRSGQGPSLKLTHIKVNQVSNVSRKINFPNKKSDNSCLLLKAIVLQNFWEKKLFLRWWIN